MIIISRNYVAEIYQGFVSFKHFTLVGKGWQNNQMVADYRSMNSETTECKVTCKTETGN